MIGNPADQRSRFAPSLAKRESMRLLFVGETWQGSSARSMREALAAIGDVAIQEIGEDHFLPRYTDLRLRIANRILRPLQERDLRQAIISTAAAFKPDALVVYKGAGVDAATIELLRRNGVVAVNIFPDYSPHAYGSGLEQAMGEYDLVISTKPFHPHLWRTTYGYRNRCVCVPHGYDPRIHFWDTPARAHEYDIVLCATWRPEYHRLMVALSRELDDADLKIAIGGSGWRGHHRDLPNGWDFVGALAGPAYGGFLRSGRIALAPVHRDVVIRGKRQPGDEDTTRTYELAAAYCFFLHQRTEYVESVYDEATEVPMWSSVAELAQQIRRWLADETARAQYAARAHARAVPNYSIPERARQVRAEIEKAIDRK
jgi:hypothetical protein